MFFDFTLHEIPIDSVIPFYEMCLLQGYITDAFYYSNVLISRPLKLFRLEAFDFNTFRMIRVALMRRVSLLHLVTNEELHKEKFLIRLMHVEYLSFPN